MRGRGSSLCEPSVPSDALSRLLLFCAASGDRRRGGASCRQGTACPRPRRLRGGAGGPPYCGRERRTALLAGVAAFAHGTAPRSPHPALDPPALSLVLILRRRADVGCRCLRCGTLPDQRAGALAQSSGDLMTNTDVRPARSSSAMTVGLCLFLLAIVFFLWTEHRAHLFGVLPWLFLLACPFIHLLMHRGHGHGASGHTSSPSETGGAHRHGGAS